MQFPGQGKPPLGVIFDSDLGNQIEDALALALLYGFDGKNEARVVALSVSKSNLKSAALCEVIGRFYGGAVSGAFAAVGRTLPVGMADNGKMPEDTPMLTAPLQKKNAAGALAYGHGIQKLTDTAEVPALVRNALTSQYDQNCVVVCAGPATNLAALLSLANIKDLIATKSRYLVMSGGRFGDGAPDLNTQTDVAAARRVLAEWPTPVYVVGREVGEQLPFPGASIEKDFAWTPDHPVVDAYKAYRAMPYDAPATDVAAVLYAIKPQEGYFKVSEPGTITVRDDGSTLFSASAQGRHRYLMVDPAQKERVLKTYTEVASAKPVPRVPRFRRPQVEAPKKQEEKKP